jgi:ribonuclease HI
LWGWGSIKIFYNKSCRWHINGGIGTNSKAELMGAWVSLPISKLWKITKVKILGDSKVIIDWLNNKSNLNSIDSEGWKCRTKALSSLFQESSTSTFSRSITKKHIAFPNKHCLGLQEN